jgi:glycosyltransferase involved in cell wall biosynthesis
MFTPKVSILMTVYNSEKFLDESISSILNQTFKDFGFIIIDDNSTDNSLNIIKKYARQDKRIILIENKKILA